MAVEQWSQDVWLVHLADDPQFTDDLASLPPGKPGLRVVLDFSEVHVITSSNIAGLLKLRQTLLKTDGGLLLCGVGATVRHAFAVTGMEQIFHFVNDVSTALAMVQLSR